MVFIWFQSLFKVVSQFRYIAPVIVVGAVITHKMFDTETKHLSATRDQLKVFLHPCGWRNSIFKSLSCIFSSVIMPTHKNVQKALDVFYNYFFGQWFVEMKLKKLSILTCELVDNIVARYWYKIVATPCFKHGLWNVMKGISLTDRPSIDWWLNIWSCRGSCKLRFTT